MKLNSDYDVPYGGGYSLDGKIVYIDKDIPEKFITYDGLNYPLKNVLFLHEVTECTYLIGQSRKNLQ